MSYLLDTNILVRYADIASPEHLIVDTCLISLGRQHEQLYICPQNITEFWAVATRPSQLNGLGLTLTETNNYVSLFRSLFLLAPDVPSIFDEWIKIVFQHGVVGRQVHDARIATFVKVYGMDHFLTTDVRDFKRFPWMSLINPKDVPLVSLADSAAEE